MPIKQSAIKYLRQTKKRTNKNKQIKRGLKSYLKKVKRTIVARDKEKLTEYAASLQKVIDKAARKGIIKKNNASRRKSRLMRQINTVLKSAE